MTVTVNHKEVFLDDSANLVDLLAVMNMPDKGIALAVNNAVIPKGKWDSFTLEESMKITLIKATQGG